MMTTQFPDYSTMHDAPGTIPINDAFEYCEELIRVLFNNRQMVSATMNYHLRKEHFEKARYALTLLDSHDLIPKVPLRHPKSDIESSDLRKRGNECFAAKKYFDALGLYNKSICFAAKESENLALGYANRSAVYLKWQLYDRCLENIGLAKKANYPERLMPKLENRRLECEARIKSTKKKRNNLGSPKLSYPPHAKIPSTADCLELVINDTYGRHMIAKRDLKVGDVVMMEKPFVMAVMGEDKYHRCANCLSENDLSLIPCPNCTASMYCSAQCLATAHEKFHKYECPVIDALFQLFPTTWVAAFRALLLLMHELKSEVESFVLEMDGQSSNTYLSKYYDQADTDKIEAIKAFHMLVHNMDKRTDSEMFQRGNMVGIMFNLLIEKTQLKDLLITEDKEDMFLNLLFRYSQISLTNFCPLKALERINDEEIEPSAFGVGAYLVGSMVNHSCTPNVVRIFYQTSEMAFMVQRPIKKGEQLFDCYIVTHCQATKQDRQNDLESHYKFICKCEACTKDFKMIDDFECAPIEMPFQENLIQVMYSMDREKALHNFKKNKQYLERYNIFYPCAQICAAEDLLARTYSICYGNVSLNTKK